MRALTLITIAAVALVVLFLLAGCASSPDTTDLARAMSSIPAGNSPASGGIDSGDDEQSDKPVNIGASYMGSVDQKQFSMYGSRKNAESMKTGKIQTGLMFGSVNMERAAALRKERIAEDPVIIGLLARQAVLLKAFEAADVTDAARALLSTELDAIDVKLAAASAAADEAIASMGGAASSLTHLTVINVSGGDAVGRDPTDTTAAEAAANAAAAMALDKILAATNDED